METLQKIQEVATAQEIYIINVATRVVMDEYENQVLENWKPITEFMENDEVKLIDEIQRRTYDKFGGAGMVMCDVIITTCYFINSLKNNDCEICSSFKQNIDSKYCHSCNKRESI